MLEELQAMAAAFGAALAEAGGCCCIWAGEFSCSGRGEGAERRVAAHQARPQAFQQSSGVTGGHLDTAAGSKAYAHAAGQHAHALQSDSDAAMARLQDACRSLVQVVWITSVSWSAVEDLLDQ